MSSAGHAVSDLRARADFVPVVADRVWRAWWQEKLPLADLEAMVRESLGSPPIPFCLVAHRDDVFLGTVSVILCDLDARPAYAPWLAALWVEPAARRAGIARSLVERAETLAFGLAVERLHLAATPEDAPIYDRLGWDRLEDDVEGLVVFARRNPARA